MQIRFWGTRGSLPVAPHASTITDKVADALLHASGKTFTDKAAALDYARNELEFAVGQGYGGATSCVVVDVGAGAVGVCDMGSGLREYGLDTLRRQQEEISFPVPFDWLRANIEFHTLETGREYQIGELAVSMIKQNHSHDSYGYRFRDKSGRVAIYSTDAEYKIDRMEEESAMVDFIAGADLVIADTMYSLADSVSMKEDWGHSSNIIAVDLCHEAGARRLALFHHEPTYSDADIQRMHAETIRYEELTRNQSELEVLCSYDGLCVQL
jgi:hypothetical protein